MTKNITILLFLAFFVFSFSCVNQKSFNRSQEAVNKDGNKIIKASPSPDGIADSIGKPSGITAGEAPGGSGESELLDASEILEDRKNPDLIENSENTEDKVSKVYKDSLSRLKEIEKRFKDGKLTKKNYHLENALIYLKLSLFANDLGKTKEIYRKLLSEFNLSGHYWDTYWVNENSEEAIAMREADILHKGDSIADIGVGPGFFLFNFCEKVGKEGKVYAVDINPDCLQFLAKVKKSKEYPNVYYVHSKYTDTTLPPNSLNIAFMRGCEPLLIKEIEGRPKQTRNFLRNIHQTLRKNGKLLVSNNVDEIEEGISSVNIGDEQVAKITGIVQSAGDFKLIYKRLGNIRFVLIYEKMD